MGKQRKISSGFPPAVRMRGVCGRQRHNPHNARRQIAQRWRRRFRKLRRKTRVRRGGDIRHQNVREIPGGPFGETVIVARPDCPEISGRPADFITVAFRRGNRYMRPAGNAGKAERGFLRRGKGCTDAPKTSGGIEGGILNNYPTRVSEPAERPSAPIILFAQAGMISERITSAPPENPPVRRKRPYGKSKPPANMKKSGAGTGQAAQTAMANGAGNLLIVQNLSTGARRITLFFRSVPRLDGQKLI